MKKINFIFTALIICLPFITFTQIEILGNYSNSNTMVTGYNLADVGQPVFKPVIYQSGCCDYDVINIDLGLTADPVTPGALVDLCYNINIASACPLSLSCFRIEAFMACQFAYVSIFSKPLNSLTGCETFQVPDVFCDPLCEPNVITFHLTDECCDRYAAESIPVNIDCGNDPGPDPCCDYTIGISDLALNPQPVDPGQTLEICGAVVVNNNCSEPIDSSCIILEYYWNSLLIAAGSFEDYSDCAYIVVPGDACDFPDAEIRLITRDTCCGQEVIRSQTVLIDCPDCCAYTAEINNVMLDPQPVAPGQEMEICFDIAFADTCPDGIDTSCLSLEYYFYDSKLLAVSSFDDFTGCTTVIIPHDACFDPDGPYITILLRDTCCNLEVTRAYPVDLECGPCCDYALSLVNVVVDGDIIDGSEFFCPGPKYVMVTLFNAGPCDMVDAEVHLLLKSVIHALPVSGLIIPGVSIPAGGMITLPIDQFCFPFISSQNTYGYFFEVYLNDPDCNECFFIDRTEVFKLRGGQYPTCGSNTEFCQPAPYITCGMALARTVTSPKGYSSPNPARNATAIHYELEQPSKVDIVIYSLDGRKIVHFKEGFREAGTYQAVWDFLSAKVESGIYLCRIKTDFGTDTHKIRIFN